MDGKGRIAGPADIVECESDATALDLAKEKLDGKDLEVWEGARFLGRYNHLTRERDDPK
jgi:hypothetical protein